MEISPIAHVALLHTEMNSGFRLVPKIGMKSARKNNNFTTTQITELPGPLVEILSKSIVLGGKMF